MPVIQVSLIRGYSGELKQRLCARLTDAVRHSIAADPEGITVLLHEVEPDAYMRGGRQRMPGAEGKDGKPGMSAEQVVRAFLSAMEARDLGAAKTLLDDEFVMTFPGSGEMHRLEELVAWAGGRYRFVRKCIAAVETCGDGDETTVFCHGELSGEWPDGTPFSGVRFIDRFELCRGRIVRQQVWNDLALARP
ncbi:tautomerase family protein [Halomonas sp. ANAO-440]|uniref:tautomerase family protein n=1 Tax=Halomonas sp. ANAO-440 TaxID=2861360 RepID=UPI001CAA63EA|nr:tautomerase family protein [Halomonas sp. ANAO-440]MBZ0329625.1 tautomerase family protein [Halomonas sp. ANAO-440]